MVKSSLFFVSFGAFNIFHEYLLDISNHCLTEAEWRTCVNKLTIIDSNNGLSPGRHQVIIWTNAGLLLLDP